MHGAVGQLINHYLVILNIRVQQTQEYVHWKWEKYSSWVSNIESDNSQNVGLEDYNNISDGIFPHFTTPSIKIGLG